MQREQVIAELDTVRATSFEFGAEWNRASSTFDVAVYHIDQDNIIIRDSDFFNIDGQSTESVGLELTYKVNLNEQWSIASVATLARHEYTSNPNADTLIDGNRLDTAPTAYGNISLVWNATQKSSTKLEMDYLSDYFLDIDNDNEYPGHTLLNLKTSYQLNNDILISLRVNNLADELYAERADFTSFTGARYFPGSPRSFYGALQWTF